MKKITKKTKKAPETLRDVLAAAVPALKLMSDVARALGISRQHLSCVANGHCTLSPGLAEKVARVYRIPRHKLAPFVSKRGPGRPPKVGA